MPEPSSVEHAAAMLGGVASELLVVLALWLAIALAHALARPRIPAAGPTTLRRIAGRARPARRS